MNRRPFQPVLWAAVMTIAMCPAPAASAEQSEHDSIVAALIDVTRDADEEVRLAAFTVLARQPRTDAIADAFRRGLEDDSLDVRRKSLSKLVDYEGATDEIMRRLASLINEPEMEDLARKRLAEIGEPAVPLLLEALEKKETTVVAAGLLGSMTLGEQRTRVVDQLKTLLKDDDKEVRLAAIEAMGSIVKNAGWQEPDQRLLSYGRQILTKYDKNADGVLTEDEWLAMSSNPSLADQNKDGRITLQEFTRWISSRVRPR